VERKIRQIGGGEESREGSPAGVISVPHGNMRRADGRGAARSKQKQVEGKQRQRTPFRIVSCSPCGWDRGNKSRGGWRRCCRGGRVKL